MAGRSLAPLAAKRLAEKLPDDYPCLVISRAAQADQHITIAQLAATIFGPAPVLVIGGWVLSSRVAPSKLQHSAPETNLPRAELHLLQA